MRAVFYALGCTILAVGGLGIAMLPLIAPNWWIFVSIGSGAAMLVLGGWVGLRAAAGDDWPRPRTRHMLVITGAIGMIVSLRAMLWQSALWSLAVVLVGLFFTLKRSSTVKRSEF